MDNTFYFNSDSNICATECWVIEYLFYMGVDDSRENIKMSCVQKENFLDGMNVQFQMIFMKKFSIKKNESSSFYIFKLVITNRPGTAKQTKTKGNLCAILLLLFFSFWFIISLSNERGN